MFDFEVVKKANLRKKGELDTLFGVSRIMVSRYLHGGAIPRGDNRARIKKVIIVISKCVDQGILPFDDDVDEQTRKTVVSKIRLQSVSA
jgi:hypothetical protein